MIPIPNTATKILLAFAFATVSFAASQGEIDFYNVGSEDGWNREYSVGETYNVRRVSAPTRSGETALRMETRYGDTGNGYHTEMELLGAGGPGESAWYGFSTYVPTSWVDSEQPSVTAQWWSHSPAGPPLALRIEAGEWVVLQRWDGGEENIALRPVGAVRKGEWTDWVVEAYWSDAHDGYLKVWRDGEVVHERSGPNIYWETESLRFKIGLYVWPWKNSQPSPLSSSPRVIYHDEIRVGGEGSSYDEVKPGG